MRVRLTIVFFNLKFWLREPNSQTFISRITSSSSIPTKHPAQFSAIFVNGDRLRPVVVRSGLTIDIAEFSSTVRHGKLGDVEPSAARRFSVNSVSQLRPSHLRLDLCNISGSIRALVCLFQGGCRSAAPFSNSVIRRPSSNATLRPPSSFRSKSLIHFPMLSALRICQHRNNGFPVSPTLLDNRIWLHR